MAAPTVTSVTPATDDHLGGAAVLISGTNLTGATRVLFGSTATTDFTVVSSTEIVVTAPAHEAGMVTVAVTTADGTSADAVTFTYTGTAALFSVSEARAFYRGELSSAVVYSDARISSKEADIRSKFERIIGAALTPTISTEYYDGDGTDTLYLTHHNPWAEATPRAVTLTSVTVIATDDTETAFTAAELADVVTYPHKLVRRSGVFERGVRNIKVVYTHGYETVPDDIKTAALHACVQELMPTNLPASVIDGAEGAINWSRVKDPGRGRWYGNESIDAVLREHRAIETMPRIA